MLQSFRSRMKTGLVADIAKTALMTQSGPHAKRRVESTKRTTLLQADLFDYCVSACNFDPRPRHASCLRIGSSNCLRLSLTAMDDINAAHDEVGGIRVCD